MIRKLVQHGPSTLITSIPKQWINRNELKKGDEIEISEESNKLIISLPKEKPKTKALELSFKDEFLRRYIASAYRRGYNEVTITFDDPRTIALINDVLTEILGFEIINQTRKSVTIKCFAQATADDLEKTMNRLLFIAVSIAKDLPEIMEQNDASKYDEIIAMEKTSNKLAHYCQRILNCITSKPTDELTNAYLVVELFEQIIDDYRDLCSALKQKKSVKTDEVMRIKKVAEVIDATIQLLRHFDKKQMYDLKASRSRITEDITKSIGKEGSNATSHYADMILRKLKHIETNICE